MLGYSKQARNGAQLGLGHGLALSFGASLSVSGLQFFNLQNAGVGESLSQCVILCKAD